MSRILRSVLIYLIAGSGLLSCIGDDFVMDFVMPHIEISNPIDSLKVNESHQFESRYFNNIGVVDSTVATNWQSLNPNLLSITPEGLATAIANGYAEVVVISQTNPPAYDTVSVIANELNTSIPVIPLERSGVIKSTSSYLLEGDVEIVDENGQIILRLGDNFRATTALPGLVVYLTNNPSTNSGALEIGPITQFVGAQEFILSDLTDITEYDFVLFYCKPFAVKVGDGELL
jgi:hypothetical protein